MPGASLALNEAKQIDEPSYMAYVMHNVLEPPPSNDLLPINLADRVVSRQVRLVRPINPRVCRPAQTADCGRHFRLVGAAPPSQQRLRIPARHLRSLDLHRHDGSHAGTPRRSSLTSFRTPSQRHNMLSELLIPFFSPPRTLSGQRTPLKQACKRFFHGA